jgi:hypothetical protein
MMLLLSVPVLTLPLREFSSRPQIVDDYALLILAAAPLIWIWFRRVRPHLAPRIGWKAIPIGRRSTRYAAVVVALVSATMVTTMLRRSGGICPHAHYHSWGPLSLAWSNNGGPCRERVAHGATHLLGNWYFYSTWFDWVD